MTRRRFVQTSAAAPAILGAQDKTGNKRPIIGSGEHTYEVFHDWGELPPHIKYGNTHGVCEDSHGRMYATIDDGGVQLSTNDTQIFAILLLTFQSGQFTIRFRRQGTDVIRGYSICANLSVITEPSGRFRDCMTAMLAVVKAK